MADSNLSLRILLIGNGGREHALAWKLSQSPKVEHIIVVPGNGGTSSLPKVINEPSVSAGDHAALVQLARSRGINLVVPGPEAPLVDGIEGHFRSVGIAVFGPSQDAARLEGSKAFSKDFMVRHGIPTAAYRTFTDYEAAVDYVKSVPHPVVIKASGLAAGKGVILPRTTQECCDALHKIMVKRVFGSAGDEVVVEEFLIGEELSILSFCDGYTIRSLPAAQDHKRIFDGDQGPNTGGMGCYAPTKIATPQLMERIEAEILKPTIHGMLKDRTPFRGLLFTGIIVTSDGPKALEYNVRFGDPETQTLLPLLAESCDLAQIMLACSEGWLYGLDIDVEPKFSVTVVASACGYPAPYAKDDPITIERLPPSAVVFHAGTELIDGELRTNGGRVLGVNATADTLHDAVRLAYDAFKSVRFPGMHYRTDIGKRALAPQAPKGTLTYAQAGVSIDAGNAFVERIRKAVASTKRLGADAEIGGFGGEFDLEKYGIPDGPILVAAIDGVGTKLMIAQAMGKHHTVGIDLVAMNVNDLVVQGAEPLMFLDYYGCSKLNSNCATAFVEGVAEGCRQAGCALVGGETAEMPGMYQMDDYDAAGAAVGIVARTDRLPRQSTMMAGDVLLGLASSGIHSNGFSLVRRIVQEAGLGYSDPAPWDPSVTLGDALLTPTRIYVRCLLPLIARRLVKGLSHITGGGLIENVPRMLPSNLACQIDLGAWRVPAVFEWLRAAGNVPAMDMCRTFNNGIGMVLAVDPHAVDAVVALLPGERVLRIGTIVERTQDPCHLLGLDNW